MRLLRGLSIVPSLRQLLALHPSLLLVDSCSTRVEAALWHGDLNSPPVTASQDGEASDALPAAVSNVLAAAGRKIASLDAVVFCEGPGSVLGIRLAAASLRAWRAINPSLALYSYQSLPLLASAHPGFVILADARRDSWHAVQPENPSQIQRLPTADLAPLALAHPLGSPATFRRWSTPPANVELHPLAYSAAALLSAAPDTPFFTAAPEPEAYLTEAPSYVTWTPQIHQAPGTRPTA
ncbi:MAG: hypothetical protein RL376_268 [Verrucomicrobiota bacterium]